jgi:hypothetical protein
MSFELLSFARLAKILNRISSKIGPKFAWYRQIHRALAASNAAIVLMIVYATI